VACIALSQRNLAAAPHSSGCSASRQTLPITVFKYRYQKFSRKVQRFTQFSRTSLGFPGHRKANSIEKELELIRRKVPVGLDLNDFASTLEKPKLGGHLAANFHCKFGDTRRRRPSELEACENPIDDPLLVHGRGWRPSGECDDAALVREGAGANELVNGLLHGFRMPPTPSTKRPDAHAILE
jgi:hypothetical protein